MKWTKVKPSESGNKKWKNTIDFCDHSLHLKIFFTIKKSFKVVCLSTGVVGKESRDNFLFGSQCISRRMLLLLLLASNSITLRSGWNSPPKFQQQSPGLRSPGFVMGSWEEIPQHQAVGRVSDHHQCNDAQSAISTS
jgi:hypothetical protein